MLHELCIRNYAIIDDLALQFVPGLNILTGETGAGKSIIIDALGLLLGDRASTDSVRAGTDSAHVEATFLLDTESEIASSLISLLKDEELDESQSPEWLTLSREVRLNGRNVCRVNGRVVSLQILSQLAGHLIDVHGQGEHLNLLRPRTHGYLLDHYGSLISLRHQVSSQVAELRQISSELQRLRQDARTIAQRVDLLSFQTEEISIAALRPGQEEELEGERRRLGNAEALLKLSKASHTILSEGESDVPGAIDLIGEAVGRIERLARIDPDMHQTADEAQGLLEQISDLARGLQDYADRLEFNPERLLEVEDRLELIHSLKRKYGDTIEQILEHERQAQAELDELKNWEVRTEELEEAEDRILHSLGRLATELSEKRKDAGERLGRQVESELADLRMERARFGVAVTQSHHPNGAYLADGSRVSFDSTGIDQVEFLISTNPGEPLRPLAKVASGGETARLMLALKSVLAHADATPTLIFDEIDQGIGGRVGSVVGQKLWHLTGQQAKPDPDARSVPHQILCITHLPQLAAFGDKHLTVTKHIQAVNGEERTSTVVEDLEESARLEELAQMLGATSAAGRRSVQEMMAEVAQAKDRK